MSAKINVVTTQARADVQAIVNSTNNTSAKIRALHSLGIPNGEIALLLDKKYQHVRNVLITPVAKPKEVTISEPATKEEFAEMFGA